VILKVKIISEDAIIHRNAECLWEVEMNLLIRQCY